MSFTILQKNTTITASKVNDNFLHVGQGDLLPRGGTSLTAIGSTYNLGSDQYRWETANINNIYADSANISKIPGNFYFLDSYEINSINTATTRISFDVSEYAYSEMEIHLYLADCTTNAYMFINGNSAGSSAMSIRGFTGTTEIMMATSTSGILVALSGTDDSTAYTFSRVLFQFAQGVELNCGMFISMNGSGDPYVGNCVRGVFDYDFTGSSSITSLVFTGNFQTGASIKLWGIV